MNRCQQVTQDYERSFYQRLSFKDKMAIYVHSIICRKCHKYMKDSKTLDKLIAKHAKEKFNIMEVYSEAEKDRLKDKLRAS